MKSTNSWHVGVLSSSGLSRRAVLVGGVAFFSSLALNLTAQTAQTAAPAAAALFLQISRALTGHAELDGELAERLFAALKIARPQFAGEAKQLYALVQVGSTPEALLAQANAAGLKDAALAIVAAWYTGSVGDAMNAPMVAYRDALMYWPTRDGLPAPTYCFGRPGWWIEVPPALGIPMSAPRSAAADVAPEDEGRRT